MRTTDLALYILLFVFIIGLIAYDSLSDKLDEREGFSLDNYLKNPQKHGDVKMESMVKIVNISNGYFYARTGNSYIKVEGSGVKNPVLGETAVFLHYRKDGIIELIDYHNYNYNYFLYAISFLALIVFIIIFFNEWKLTRRGFESA